MNRTAILRSLALRTLPIAMLAMVAAAPLATLAAVEPRQGGVIEAPANKNSGAGFVLMVSLQRR